MAHAHPCLRIDKPGAHMSVLQCQGMIWVYTAIFARSWAAVPLPQSAMTFCSLPAKHAREEQQILSIKHGRVTQKPLQWSKVSIWLLPIGMPDGDGITFVCDETCLSKDLRTVLPRKQTSGQEYMCIRLVMLAVTDLWLCIRSGRLLSHYVLILG